jgi:2-polyprenyl-3-methyl-5-hydroxy-6-metoxy-1,4-benzoquinol methylase
VISPFKQRMPRRLPVAREEWRVTEYRPAAYWEDLLARQYDLSGVAYPDFPVGFNRALYQRMRAAVLRLVSRGGVRLSGAEVLEIGPGTGFWIDLWQERGAARVTGLDLTQTAVTHLQERFPKQRFLVGDVGSEGVDLGSFDVVSAMSVLLHVVDEQRFATALRNLSGMLRPEGSMLIMEPLVEHAWWGPPVDSTSNSKARTLSEWDQALAAAGLQCVLRFPVTALLANVCDTRHRTTWRLHMAYWWLVRRWLSAVPRLIGLTLRLLTAADRMLLAVGITPSTKVMLVRHMNRAT